MIYAFTGLGGSSKTYNMVKRARWYWLNGINIYTNTKLLFSKYSMEEQRKGLTISKHPKDFNYLERFLHFLFKKEYTRGKIIYYDQIEEIQSAKDGIVLFDEGQVLFNSGAWKDISDEFKYKVSQERKHDLDFFTTTRRFRSILIDYRQEVHEWFYCKEILSIKIGKKNKKKILIGLFRISQKDMEAVREDLPDRDTPDIRSRFLIIHYWSKRLYDTKYDIGFKPVKIMRTNIYDNNNNVWKKTFLILPKKMNLKDGLNAIYMMSRALSPTKLKGSSKNMRSYA